MLISFLHNSLRNAESIKGKHVIVNPLKSVNSVVEVFPATRGDVSGNNHKFPCGFDPSNDFLILKQDVIFAESANRFKQLTSNKKALTTKPEPV